MYFSAAVGKKETFFLCLSGVSFTNSQESLHYLFIYLAAPGLAACGIFDCGMQTLSCGIWELFPNQGSNPGPLHWEQSLSHWTTTEVPCLQF